MILGNTKMCLTVGMWMLLSGRVAVQVDTKLLTLADCAAISAVAIAADLAVHVASARTETILEDGFALAHALAAVRLHARVPARRQDGAKCRGRGGRGEGEGGSGHEGGFPLIRNFHF